LLSEPSHHRKRQRVYAGRHLSALWCINSIALQIGQIGHATEFLHPTRVHAPARAYLQSKQNEGKSRREAIRCLKRQLARTVYTTLKSESALT
jgi:hypothetical protein